MATATGATEDERMNLEDALSAARYIKVGSAPLNGWMFALGRRVLA